MKLDLTSSEIFMIKTALVYLSQRKLDKINQCRKIMTKSEIQATQQTSDAYYSLYEKINNQKENQEMLCQECQEVVCDCDD